jgi:hypothetical protein
MVTSKFHQPSYFGRTKQYYRPIRKPYDTSGRPTYVVSPKVICIAGTHYFANLVTPPCPAEGKINNHDGRITVTQGHNHGISVHRGFRPQSPELPTLSPMLFLSADKVRLLSESREVNNYIQEHNDKVKLAESEIPSLDRDIENIKTIMDESFSPKSKFHLLPTRMQGFVDHLSLPNQQKDFSKPPIGPISLYINPQPCPRAGDVLILERLALKEGWGHTFLCDNFVDSQALKFLAEMYSIKIRTVVQAFDGFRAPYDPKPCIIPYRCLLDLVVIKEQDVFNYFVNNDFHRFLIVQDLEVARELLYKPRSPIKNAIPKRHRQFYVGCVTKDCKRLLKNTYASTHLPISKSPLMMSPQVIDFQEELAELQRKRIEKKREIAVLRKENLALRKTSATFDELIAKNVSQLKHHISKPKEVDVNVLNEAGKEFSRKLLLTIGRKHVLQAIRNLAASGPANSTGFIKVDVGKQRLSFKVHLSVDPVRPNNTPVQDEPLSNVLRTGHEDEDE